MNRMRQSPSFQQGTTVTVITIGVGVGLGVGVGVAVGLGVGRLHTSAVKVIW